MLNPLYRYFLWVLVAIWLATGIAGLRTPVEREIYGQVRALAAGSLDVAPDTALAPGATQRPGVAVLALPFYGVGRLSSFFWVDDPANPNGLTAQTTQLAAAFAAATALVLLGLCGVALNIHRIATNTMVVLLAVASPVTIYGARLSPPIFGLLATAGLTYAVLRLRQKDPRRRIRVLLGTAAGTMLMLDDALLLLAVPALIWGLMMLRRAKKGPLYAWPTLAVFGAFVALAMLINQATWGGFLNAPDGKSVGGHFVAVLGPALGADESYLVDRLWPAIKLWLASDAVVPAKLADAWGWGEAARSEPFLGLFVLFPVLAVGLLGAFALKADNAGRWPLRVLGIVFWLGLALHVLTRPTLCGARADVAATLPLWTPYLIGIGFFLHYHLWEMPGLIWKNLLRVVFWIGLVAALGNAWYAVAANNVGPPVVVTGLVVDPPAAVLPAALGAAGHRGVRLPGDLHDALFLDANRTIDWALNHSASFMGTFRPGLNNLGLFVPILLLTGFLPLFFMFVFGRVPPRLPEFDIDDVPRAMPHRRRRETPPPDDRDEPPPDEGDF